MKKILKIIIYISLILIITYTLFWYIIMLTVSKKINSLYSQKELSQNIYDNYRIKFNTVNITGYPFTFALRINNLQEENNKSLIVHQNPLTVGYNIIRQKFFIKYNGISTAKYKTIEQEFGKIISCNALYDIKYPINLKFIQNIINKDYKNLIQNINQIEFTTKDIKIYDMINNNLILESSLNKYQVIIGDQWKNALPTEYKFTNFINIEKANNTNLLAAPFSIIYGILVDTQLKESLTGKIHILGNNFSSIWKILSNTSIEIEQFNSESMLSKNEVKLSYNNKMNNDNLELNFNFYGKIIPNPGYAKFNSQLFHIMSLGKYHPKIDLFKTVAYLIGKYQNQIDTCKSIVTEINLNFLISKEDVKLSLKNFSISANDIGIMINNNSELKIFDYTKWTTEGRVVLYQADKILDLVYDNFLYDKSLPYNINCVIKNINKTFFREISLFPKSNANDLLFNYSFLDKIFKINTTNTAELKDIYSNIFYKHVENNANIPNPKLIIQQFEKNYHDFKELFYNKNYN